MLRYESIRDCPTYTLNDSPLAKPIKVMLKLWASSTASDDGAPTATTMGMRAMSAFCMISKLDRPETMRMRSVRGSRWARKQAPISLSTAL